MWLTSSGASMGSKTLQRLSTIIKKKKMMMTTMKMTK
jgi:hypothetical protein